ncbi:DUF58 domain-containing protein [Paenibacillus sp. JNUCC31]|uniref:DUF58 domain-containing protein n=1 Tax=Paenibacillus sp. JNUCC-31 TaxID=2777983 RepID=UPI00177AA63B|nr:DUF58 domain-containing protein [Paenibacillus sp. JNUCC-31]QOS76831.1 DUF58 domain-containing protein [Paenibacillus sp. JNUCC-31]
MTALGQRMLGAVLVAAFASLYVWHGGKAALFLSILAALMLASGMLIHFFGPHNIIIRRQMQANRIAAGEKARVQVEVEFDCRMPLLWIILYENTPAGIHRKLIFPGARRQFTYQYELSGLRRGVYRWETGKLYWGDVFGWNTVSAEITVHTPLIVVPQAAGWSESDSGEYSALGEDSLSERRSSQGNRSPDYREYQQGDPLGRIHWKSTAKTGRLQTFLPETSDSTSLGIMVYEGASGYEMRQSGKGDTPAFEHAVRAAAGWVYTAERDNIAYQLWMEGRSSTSDQQEKWQENFLHLTEDTHALDKLAQAQISKVQPVSPSLRTDMLDRMAPGSRIVVLTGKMDESLVDWVTCATGLGYRVEIQLTGLAAGEESPHTRLKPLGSTVEENRLHHVDDPVANVVSKSAQFSSSGPSFHSSDYGFNRENLEQLHHRGVQIQWITDGSLPSMGKAEVTDVGA